MHADALALVEAQRARYVAVLACVARGETWSTQVARELGLHTWEAAGVLRVLEERGALTSRIEGARRMYRVTSPTFAWAPAHAGALP